MDNEYMLIAQYIKYEREKKGYTQEKLAEAANISVSHLSKIELGQRRIGMNAYLSILQALDVLEGDSSPFHFDVKEDEYLTQYQSIMKDCSEPEINFLLKILKTIKENMKTLLCEL